MFVLVQTGNKLMLAFHDSPSYAPYGDFHETEADAWPDADVLSVQEFCEGEEPQFPALDSEILNGQFRAWKGKSGRRHIFSVYKPQECPTYCYAILVGAVVEANGRRRVFFIGDTGTLPEPTIRRAREAAAALSDPVEFHVHLLAQTKAEREAVTEDIWVEAMDYRS
jgi:hypothetical protein